MPWVLAILCALFAGLGNVDSADAHTRSISYSLWELNGREARVQVRLPLLEVTRLRAIGIDERDGPAISQYMAEHLRLTTEAGACVIESGPRPKPSAEGWSAHSWELQCPSDESIEIVTAVMLDLAPSHLHFARLRDPDGSVRERVLFAADTSWKLTSAADAADDDGGTRFAGYLALGVEHILSGWDHLAFVLALLLLASRLGEVARLVTGFTLAHSVTLALAVLGWVHPDAAAVETVIAFSVALVAAENGWILGGRQRIVPAAVGVFLLGCLAAALLDWGALPWIAVSGLLIFSLCHFGILESTQRPERWRVALAFAFGLVHGFGFAGILAEMSLPTDRLVPALLGFNLGVEIGQLGVVALAWPLLVALRRVGDGGWERRVAEIGSGAICAVGLFWFVARNFG